jgi:hypothetical protein
VGLQLPLIFAKFGTGVIFAKLFTFIIILGIVHGFFALPLMLAQCVATNPGPSWSQVTSFQNRSSGSD